MHFNLQVLFLHFDFSFKDEDFLPPVISEGSNRRNAKDQWIITGVPNEGKVQAEKSSFVVESPFCASYRPSIASFTIQ